MIDHPNSTSQCRGGERKLWLEIEILEGVSVTAPYQGKSCQRHHDKRIQITCKKPLSPNPCYVRCSCASLVTECACVGDTPQS
jgi:hypothetical protein